MSPPWRAFAVISLGAAYAATALSRRSDLPDRPSVEALAKKSQTSLFTSVLISVWLIQAVSYFIWSAFLYPFFFSPLRHLPQPTGNKFIFGQFLRIHHDTTGEPALEWVNSIPNEGVIRYLGVFNQERLLIVGPKALSEVLVTKNYDFVKPGPMRKLLSRLLGDGILLAEGDEHRFQRKHLAPAFAFRHVKSLYPVFWGKGRESVEAMRADIARQSAAEDGKEVSIEVGNWASRVTLDIIGVAGMGRDFNSVKDPDNELARRYNMTFSPNKQARILGLLSLVFPLWFLHALPVKRNKDIIQTQQFVRDTCRNIIIEKKSILASRREKLAKELDAPDAGVDILSVALESGAFSEDNLVDQLMTFLAAGHETTASAMTWAIYMLCIHPDVQERLRTEIREHLPALGDRRTGAVEDGLGQPSSPIVDVTSTEIDHLPYLNAVCSEVLRYYSPVPNTMRETAVDTSIQGQFVPKGTTIMLTPWAVNKSVALWGPEAKQFNPDRWLAANGKDAAPNSSNYAFLTFLHGPRSCIGMQFARSEFACLLATWVGRFSFRLRDMEYMDEKKMDIKGGVTARPAKGMHVYATPLDGW